MPSKNSIQPARKTNILKKILNESIENKSFSLKVWNKLFFKNGNYVDTYSCKKSYKKIQQKNHYIQVNE